MLFNSSVFLAFSFLFFGVWFLLRSQPWRLAVLIFASFIFYSWWNWKFLSLILLSGGVDFMAALIMTRRPPSKKLMLLASIGANVAILCSFKYLGFFGEIASAIIPISDSALKELKSIPLPVGISFYTFQSMSYTIDVYRGRLEATRSPLLFFAYLSMFPQLVAGPIERGGHLMPQLKQFRNPSPSDCREGWTLIVLGYFKKCVLADNLAPFVDKAFNHPGMYPSGLFWWIVMGMFAMQIYCDFSGYTDIARGLARFMGIDLARNFNKPYQALGIRDFWRRWNITLSAWFRDYIYIPLGGNRKGRLRTHLNLWITMALSGLWHGAGVNFVVWGLFHAAMISTEHLILGNRNVKTISKTGKALLQALTVGLVVVAWVFFRAESWGQALTVLSRMFSFSGLKTSIDYFDFAYWSFTVGMIAMLITSARRLLDVRLDFEAPVYWALPFMVVLTVYFRGPGFAFIYFQF